MSTREERLAALDAAIGERNLVLDGAMGTSIQARGLDEQDFRGGRFVDFPRRLTDNYDLLNITQPQIVSEIHRAYLDADADIIETNTFNSTRIAQAGYRMGDLVAELNREGARLAREAADEATAADRSKPRWVAGVIGPTHATASLSSEIGAGTMHSVSFDELSDGYREAASALVDGGVDVLLVETVFDTLSVEAALSAIAGLLADRAIRVPVMVSATTSAPARRTPAAATPSGLTVEAFWNAVRDARPFSVGLNCSFGAHQLRPHLVELASIADVAVSAHPNAGLPNELGEYEETPEITSRSVHGWAEDGLVNIVGGCCGTTPEHIRRISERVAGVKPRPLHRTS